MESKVNYTVVGVFVLFFSAALIAFAFWLGKYNDDESKYRRYKIYITESVAGLAPEASVKFHGVDVGMVESIRINPLNSEEVELLLKIRQETPVKIDSTATLKFFGVTGLAFIEISGGAKNTPLLPTSADNPGVIPTTSSLIKRIDESLSQVATTLTETLQHIDQIFSDKNNDNVSETLENLKFLSRKITAYQDEIDLLLKNTIETQKNLDRTMAKVSDSADSVNTSANTFKIVMRDNMAPTLKSLKETSLHSHALIQKIDQSIDRGDYNLQSIASPATTELGELLEQTRTLSAEMERTLKTLRESPSDILFKQSKPIPGPGE